MGCSFRPYSLTAEGKLFHRSDPKALVLLGSLPGSMWNSGDNYWSVSLDPGDRRRLLEVAHQLGVNVDPSLRLPLSPAAIRAREAGLYPFQVEGVDWLSRRKKALLTDEMGLGKTVQALFALPPGAAVLVVGPACLKYNWREEASRWRPDFNVSVIEGKKNFRLPSPGEMVVVSYDSLPDEVKPSDLQSIHLIGDETHKLKNQKSKRTKRFRKLAGSAGSVWALTGTPLLNQPGELFAMLEALGMQKETFQDWPNFLKLFNGKKDFWGKVVWGDPSVQGREQLRRVMVRRLRCDVLPELPVKQYQTLLVPLPLNDPALKDEMNELWGQYRPFLEDREDLPPFPTFSAIRERLARTRIKALKEFVGLYEEQGEPLVVFSAHKAPVEALKGREGWEIITGDSSSSERQSITSRFQAGGLKGIASTIQAGGVGLTMTMASTVLFVDLDWVPANNLQAEDRVCRIGQEANKVRVIRMVSDHVMDKQVLKVLDRKARLERAVIG